MEKRGGEVSGSARERAVLPSDPALLPPSEVETLAALERLLVAAELPPLDVAESGVIAAHLRLLDAWNPAINLTRIVEPSERALRHLLDALVAVPLIERILGADVAANQRIADLGSGGGFPGIPLAARLLPRRAGLRIDLVDATAKKARFLETVVAASGLAPRLAVVCARAEERARDPRAPRYDVIVARAVAPLVELLRIAAPLLKPNGSIVAWKRSGEGWPAELAAATSLVGADALTIEPVAAPALAGALLVVMTPRRRSGDGSA